MAAGENPTPAKVREQKQKDEELLKGAPKFKAPGKLRSRERRALRHCADPLARFTHMENGVLVRSTARFNGQELADAGDAYHDRLETFFESIADDPDEWDRWVTGADRDQELEALERRYWEALGESDKSKPSTRISTRS